MAAGSSSTMQACEAAEVLIGLSDGLLLLAAAADCGVAGNARQRRSRPLEHTDACTGHLKESATWQHESHCYVDEADTHTSHKRSKCSSPARTTPAAHWLVCQYSWNAFAPRLELNTQESWQEAQPQESEISLGMWQSVASEEEDEVESGSSVDSSSASTLDLFCPGSDEEDISSLTSRLSAKPGSFAFPCPAGESFPVLFWRR